MEFEDIQSLCGAKRRSFTQTQRAAHVAEWQRSGMSAADYAHTHQLGLSSLYRWRHLYAESVSQASPFVPVRIKVDQSSSDCRLRVTLKTPQLKTEPTHAREMMKLISDLYELEEAWDRAGISNAARKIKRSEQSKPIAETIKAHLDGFAADLTIPKGAFQEAVRYTANQWTALWECFEHGHTRLDTNLLESKFRATKIGAKNRMFIGHPDAGEKSAITYTLLNCCRIHRVDPQAYFQDVLDKLIPHDHRPPAELVDTLLPENWIQANPSNVIKELARA